MSFQRFHHERTPDELIIAFYQALIDSGRERDSYHPCPPRDAREHLAEVRSRGCPWWLITFNNELAGCAFLTDIEGKCACCHFAFLPNPPGRAQTGGVAFSVALGRWILAATLYDRYENGEYMIDTLVGVTPQNNRGALRLAEKCGAVFLGTIPGACYFEDFKKNEDGIIAYYTRAAVPFKWAEGNYNG